MCTVRNTSEDIVEALAAGADEFVMKPFDGEILTGKLEEAGL
jgi:two-component system chemotaxis response regulator CheY